MSHNENFPKYLFKFQGTGDTESDSSDNFQVDCYEEDAKCRLLENINADGEHNRYNVRIFNFIKKITE